MIQLADLYARKALLPHYIKHRMPPAGCRKRRRNKRIFDWIESSSAGFRGREKKREIFPPSFSIGSILFQISNWLTTRNNRTVFYMEVYMQMGHITEECYV